MSITQCKPQQQTLSIRVSESLREFLELSRQVIANGRGDAVSISDVARILLESAKEDRLDFRLEVSPNCSSRQLLRSGRSDENGSSSICCPGQSGSFSLSTFRSPVKSYLGPRGFPAQTRSSRCSKHCWPCALSGPTAVEAWTDSTWATSASQSLQSLASANSTRNLCRTPLPI
jgi:hypothetical protein